MLREAQIKSIGAEVRFLKKRTRGGNLSASWNLTGASCHSDEGN
jgi:hypothetical protein